MTCVPQVISVKVVDVFACHMVEGVRYLRVDYRIECESEEWKDMAVYASVWIACFVIAFPLYVCYSLWWCNKKLAQGFAVEDVKKKAC